MKSSYRIGRIAGIDVRVHLTFFILVVWIGWSSWMSEGTPVAALAGVGFVALVFGIVVLHELGHALVARRYGVRTKDITLLPFGGVARLERMPEEPRAELLIALAGPAVNLVLAALLCALAWALGQSPLAAGPLQPDVPLLSRLVWLNLTIAVFNLLPAFPMDGGRALRALLAWRMDRLHATRIAAGIGRTMAVLFGLVGLLWNPLLALIALFVWFAASAEAQAAELDAATHGLRVGDAMVRHFEVLAPADTLAAASEHVLAGFQTDFPVVEGGRVMGVLTHADLILGLTEHGPAGLVDTVMQRDFCTATATESLPDALTRMGTKTCRAVPVLSGENLVGVLTLSGLGELVAIRSATEVGTSHGAGHNALVAHEARG